jgi:hypothetical protein
MFWIGDQVSGGTFEDVTRYLFTAEEPKERPAAAGSESGPGCWPSETNSAGRSGAVVFLVFFFTHLLFVSLCEVTYAYPEAGVAALNS